MADLILLFSVLVVTFVVGAFLIMRVPPRLHTPLMSMTNAVSGITVLGALLLASRDGGAFETAMAAVAIVAGAFNLVGGFAVTDRMLGFFRKRGEKNG